MSLQGWSRKMWLLPALLLLVSCGQQHEARTAREFVERYTKAWQREDVDAIVAMKYDLKKFDIARIPQERRSPDRIHVREGEGGSGGRYQGKGICVSPLHRSDVCLRAGSRRSYPRRVAQGAARSDIVLVRDGGSSEDVFLTPACSSSRIHLPSTTMADPARVRL